jgi:hypothetical protein
LVLPVVRDDDRVLGCARSVFVLDEPRDARDSKLVGREQRLVSPWLRVEERSSDGFVGLLSAP